MPAYILEFYIYCSIYGMRAKNDNIGHTAHFGGAIGGYLITLATSPHLIVENTMMVILLTYPLLYYSLWPRWVNLMA
jgi:hypothetical protein